VQPWGGMNGGYLIEKVAYSLDGSRGSTTQIDVVHPDAYATKIGRAHV